jgi:hypothetical protein
MNKGQNSARNRKSYEKKNQKKASHGIHFPLCFGGLGGSGTRSTTNLKVARLVFLPGKSPKANFEGNPEIHEKRQVTKKGNPIKFTMKQTKCTRRKFLAEVGPAKFERFERTPYNA